MGSCRLLESGSDRVGRKQSEEEKKVQGPRRQQREEPGHRALLRVVGEEGRERLQTLQLPSR